MMSMARSVPATTNLPSLNSMSPAEASSACEAICLPCSTTFAAASTMAWPEFIIEREPPVPPPASSSSLSPCRMRTFSNGTPSFSLSTCANGEAWPWP